jgi:hypothetical protein
MTNNAINLLFSILGVLHEVKKERLVRRPTSIRPWHRTYQRLNRFSWKSSTIFFFTNRCPACVSFVKIGSLTAIIYCRVYINLCPYLPYCLTDLGAIRYGISLCNTVLRWLFPRKSVEWGAHFTYGCKWNASLFSAFLFRFGRSW